MTLASFLAHAVSFALGVAFSRRSRATRLAVPLTENANLAGVPLRELLDDPCGPGAVLRDSLNHRHY